MRSVFSVCLKFCWTNFRAEKQTSPAMLLVYRSLIGQDPWPARSSSSQRGPEDPLNIPGVTRQHQTVPVPSWREWFLWRASWGFSVSLHILIVVVAFSLLKYISLYEKCIVLVFLFELMLSVDFGGEFDFFFHPAFIIQLLYIFCRFLSVHSASILFHGQVEREFWWGFESQGSLPLSLCQRTWQVVNSALFRLLPSLFHSLCSSAVTGLIFLCHTCYTLNWQQDTVLK